MNLDPDLFYTGPHEALYVSRADGSIDNDALTTQIKLGFSFEVLLEESGIDRNDTNTVGEGSYRPFSRFASEVLAVNKKAVSWGG